MISLFQSSPKKHVLGTTQYFVTNFNDPESPAYVSTYGVTSCAVLLLKNIRNKKCSSFGMAHINLANIYYHDKGKENLMAFISDFESVGGRLETASIQLLGGQKADVHEVRKKTIDVINEIAREKKCGELTIKVPESYQMDTSYESALVGTGQVMAISCDQKGTYIRIITREGGKRIDSRFYPASYRQMLCTTIPYHQAAHSFSRETFTLS